MIYLLCFGKTLIFFIASAERREIMGEEKTLVTLVALVALVALMAKKILK